MQSLFRDNHHPPLLHMARSFIWLEETKERINKFSIGYMINTTLSIKKSFIEQVNKCMKTTFCAITQPHIKTTLEKKEYNNVSIINVL